MDHNLETEIITAVEKDLEKFGVTCKSWGAEKKQLTFGALNT